MVTGDLESAGRGFAEYDEQLQAAVLRFQSRHGLEPDALVGPKTLHALNVPVGHRVDQLRLNLERIRQIFDATRETFMLVNIPAFEAYLIRDGETVWKTNVIVGATETKTPLFESQMKHIVLNPTWSVPRSIASGELLPEIQKDLAFLSRRGFELFDVDGSPVDPVSVDWSALDENNFPFTLVQQPGAMNDLGRVKFIFPNQYNVCMHDTPNKYLFSSYTRAFSHGCIRIERPIAFAEKLLGPDGWTREQIDAQLVSGETQVIPLARPLPVILAYLTSMVDDAGTVYFYRDIYGRDQAMLETLDPRPN